MQLTLTLTLTLTLPLPLPLPLQACLLGEYMREAGAVELLVALLDDAAIVQLVLMVLGNATLT